mmetsp:Transcript_12623/g.18103  ORF Transcript_12623/g.18103 Transcript_12623/m.18103 type:complete len:298 (+) Transcript_12623:44-937(+)
MFGLHRSFFFSDYDCFDGPDRRGWADKSEAALRRERTADRKFDEFLSKCSSLDASDKSIFPLTEEVVDASTHLTEACWKTFRKRVENKGCKAKRREATFAERLESGDKRKGKLYVISITCSVHPSKAKEDKEKKEAAAAAKKKKAEEAAAQKARLAALHKEKVSEMYAKILGGEHDKSDSQHKTPGKPKATTTMDSFVNVKVKSADLLQHAMTVHSQRENEIRRANQSEERKLMSELMKKHGEEKQELRMKMKTNEEKLIASAIADHEEVKRKIEEACVDKSQNFVTPSASAKKQKK